MMSLYSSEENNLVKKIPKPGQAMDSLDGIWRGISEGS